MTDMIPHNSFAELRKRAEEVLANSSAPNVDAVFLQDVNRLLSELQVYQIELEMQNDELRQAQKQLATEREKYADLYNFAPVAYFTVDQDDVILSLNIAAAELLGGELRHLTGRPLAPYLAPDSLQTFIQHRNNARELRSPQTCELTIRRRNGAQAIVQVRTIALEHEDGERWLWRSVMTDITERKQKEKALLESEALYRRLVENAPAVVYTFSSKRGGIYYSSYVMKLLGYSADYLYANPFLWNESIHPEDADRIGAVIRDFGLGMPFEIEYRIRDRHGNWHWLRDRSMGGYVNGDEVLIEGLATDITDRKQAEEQLRFQANLLEVVEQSIVVTDPTSRIIYWNPFAEKLYGWSAEEVTGKKTLELIAIEESLQHGEMLMDSLNQGRSWIGEYMTRRKDGTIFPVHLTLTPLFGPDGGILGVIGVSSDITARKRIEEDLRASEEKFRSVIEQSSDGIIIANEQGTIVEWNKSQEIISGLPREEVVGQPAWDAQFRISLPEDQTPEKKDQLRQVVGTMFQKRDSSAFGKIFERAIRRADGAVRTIETVSFPIFGYSQFWIGSVMRDITERKQVEVALRTQTSILNTIFESAPYILMLVNEDGRVENINRAGVTFANREKRDLLGLLGGEVFQCINAFKDNGCGRNKECAHCPVRTKVTRTFQNGESIYNAEGSLTVLHNGQQVELQLLISTTLIQTPSGDKTLVSIVDVSELKQAEDALRQSEERFRSLVNSLSDIIYTLDTEDRHTGVFGEWVEKAGLTPEFFLGKTVREIFGAENAAVHEKANALALTGQPVSYEWFTSAQQGTRHYQTMISPLRDTSGTVIGLVGVGRDITESKRNEVLLQMRLELLEFAANHPLDELLQFTLDKVGELTHSSIGFYHLVAENQKTLILQAWSTRTLAEFCKAEGKGLHYSIDQAGVWTECVALGRPVIHNDYASLPNRKGLPEDHAAVVRELVVPIFRHGKVVAILGVGNKPSDYNREDEDLISYLADVVWEIFKHKQAEEELNRATEQLSLRLAEIEQLQGELHEQAIHDSLTGLYNRRYLEDAITREFARAAREEYPLSVIMMDMDKLKFLNDTYGHHAGDLALQALADTLKSFTRAGDIICRYGGDEFNIVMSHTGGRNAFERVEQWRQSLVDHPIQVNESTIFIVQFSAGIASFPAHGKTPDEVIRNADAALYRAKNRGRNCVVLYG